MPNQEASAGLLSRRLIFADPERSSVRISHDGTRVAFRAPVDGVLNVWVASIDRIDEARPLTAVTDRNIGPWILWMHDNRHVVFFREMAGDENWRAWRVDLETGDARVLTPGPGVTCGIQQISRHFPSELLIGHNARDKRYFDVYRVNVATGESTLVQQNEGFTFHFTDQQFRVRFAVRHTEDGDVEYLQRGSGGEWALFSRIGAEDALGTRAIEFSADGRELYWLDSRGRDTAAVVSQDLASGTMRVLAKDPRADFTELLLDPISERPVAAARAFERVAWQVFNPDYQDDFNYLTRQSRGDLTVTGISQDRRQWIVAYQYDDAPLEYFHYDRAARQMKRLFSAAPAWEGLPFVTMEPVIIRARDGLELLCYLSRPRDAQSTERLPMVLLVHGGPWTRDQWGLHANHQWLANRGYAVLSVNYRGSTGFGKAFVNAANFEWAGKMHDDLIDAVDWAIGQGIADPARVAIMGTSYGLFGFGRLDVHAREIRLRRRSRRPLQSPNTSEYDPRILDDVEIGVEGADGRLHHRGGAAVPGGTVAAQSRRPYRAAAANRPGCQRRACQTLGVGADRRRNAATQHPCDLCVLSLRRPRPRPARKPPLLHGRRRSLPHGSSRSSLRAGRRRLRGLHDRVQGRPRADSRIGLMRCHPVRIIPRSGSSALNPFAPR